MSVSGAKWSTAFQRFGFGPRADDDLSAADPREAIEAELAAPRGALIDGPGLLSGEDCLTVFYDFAAKQAAERKADAALRAAPTPPAQTPMSAAPPQPPRPSPIQVLFDAEASARVAAACAAPVGFVERLVAFWSNHFCVSTAKGQEVRAAAGAFEREAIRPHVLGRFSDMLAAVEAHPAMLHYLDNVQSTGPDSPAGRSGKRGLNENFAREIMELHTLGVDGGYAQADVTEFARILTGWTVAGPEGKRAPPGAFVFNADAHEGGARELLGRNYAAGGVEQGRAALADLARAPASARHVASKFARAFVADAPSPALTQRLEQSFSASGGDLGALARALIAEDEAWSAPPTQVRDPWQMMIAAWRALKLDPVKPQRLLHALTLLGMPLWGPPGPNGFPSAVDAWASPEGVKTRVEIAAGLGRLAKDARRRASFARVLPDASAPTREALLRAESPAQAYALLILAPEFQRR